MATEIHESNVTSKIVHVLQDFIGRVPVSQEPQSATPDVRSRQIAANASINAAVVSGTLALPPGPLGLLTIIPDLLAVWRIQAQMVSDIAGAYGKTAFLSQEQMLYCLFKHILAHSMRDIVVRVGERLIVRRASLRMLQNILQKIGVKTTQRLIGKGVSRYIPLVGALGVAYYAYYDTGKVGETSIEFFQSDINFESEK